MFSQCLFLPTLTLILVFSVMSHTWGHVALFGQGHACLQLGIGAPGGRSSVQ